MDSRERRLLLLASVAATPGAVLALAGHVAVGLVLSLVPLAVISVLSTRRATEARRTEIDVLRARAANLSPEEKAREFALLVEHHGGEGTAPMKALARDLGLPEPQFRTRLIASFTGPMRRPPRDGD